MKKYLVTAVIAFLGGFFLAGYAHAKDSTLEEQLAQTFKSTQTDFYLVRYFPPQGRNTSGTANIDRISSYIIEKATGNRVGIEVLDARGETKVIDTKDLKYFKIERTQNLAKVAAKFSGDTVVEPGYDTFMSMIKDGKAPGGDLTTVKNFYAALTKRENFTASKLALSLNGRTVDQLIAGGADKVVPEKLLATEGLDPVKTVTQSAKEIEAVK